MSLTGMVFACTGKTSGTRQQLTKKIKENGGSFSATITKKVTHLLCGEGYEDTEKYRKAKDGEVHIVNEGFLDACLQKKKKPREEDYPVGEKAEAEQSGEGDSEEEGAKEDEEASEEASKEESEKEDEEVEKEEEEEKSGKSKEESSKEEDVPATPSKRKKHEPREAKDHALKGWVVLICGRLSVPHNDMVDYIEKHGGSVTGSPNLATHVLGDAESKKGQAATELGKAIAVDEDYMRSVIKEYKEEGGDEAVAASQTPIRPSPMKKGRGKAKTIERVVSRKIHRGQPFYLVQYVGFSDSHNELLSKEDIQKSGGEKALRSFEAQLKRELKKFDFSLYAASEAEETLDSPRKAAPKKSPKKTTNKRKRMAEVEEDEEEEEEQVKGGKGKGKATGKGKGRQSVRRTLEMTDSPKKQAPKKQAPKKSPAKKRRRMK